MDFKIYGSHRNEKQKMKKQKKKQNFMTPFQKFLVLILSTLEGWKGESNLEPPGGFEHGTPGLEHWTPELQKSRYLKNKTVFFLQTNKKIINYTSRATLWQKIVL